MIPMICPLCNSTCDYCMEDMGEYLREDLCASIQCQKCDYGVNKETHALLWLIYKVSKK